MTSEWIPSTEQVRSHYVFDQGDRWNPERRAAFDRWLAAHDAEVLRKSAEAFPDNEHDAGVKPAAVRKWMNARAFRIKQGREVER